MSEVQISAIFTVAPVQQKLQIKHYNKGKGHGRWKLGEKTRYYCREKGKLKMMGDLVTFEGKNVDELGKAFVDAV